MSILTIVDEYSFCFNTKINLNKDTTLTTTVLKMGDLKLKLGIFIRDGTQEVGHLKSEKRPHVCKISKSNFLLIVNINKTFFSQFYL